MSARIVSPKLWARTDETQRLARNLAEVIDDIYRPDAARSPERRIELVGQNH